MKNIMLSVIRKNTSAYFSYFIPEFSLEVLIDKNESRLLAIKSTEAAPVNSSIRVNSLYLLIFKEVKTIRQNPSKLDEVLRM